MGQPPRMSVWWGRTCCFRFLSKRAGEVETSLALALGCIKKKKKKEKAIHGDGASER